MTGLLLVARAELPDLDFRHSVIFVTNQSGNAPVGIIINKPTRITVSSSSPISPSSRSSMTRYVTADLSRLLPHQLQPAGRASTPRQSNGGIADLSRSFDRESYSPGQSQCLPCSITSRCWVHRRC